MEVSPALEVQVLEETAKKTALLPLVGRLGLPTLAVAEVVPVEMS